MVGPADSVIKGWYQKLATKIKREADKDLQRCNLWFQPANIFSIKGRSKKTFFFRKETWTRGGGRGPKLPKSVFTSLFKANFLHDHSSPFHHMSDHISWSELKTESINHISSLSLSSLLCQITTFFMLLVTMRLICEIDFQCMIIYHICIFFSYVFLLKCGRFLTIDLSNWHQLPDKQGVPISFLQAPACQQLSRPFITLHY